MIALYCRVSTDKQDIEKQKYELLKWVERNNVKDYLFYEDDGVSGSKIFERDAITRLIDDVKDGLITAVVVYKLDRFGRNLKEVLEFIEFLEKYGVQFISISENFDYRTSTGKAMMQLLGVFAELELNIIRERTKMALKVKKEKGEWVGRVPVGYKIVDKKLKKMERDEFIKELRSKGVFG